MLGNLIRALPLGRFEREPLRVFYVIAIAIQAFTTLALGGEPTQAILQGVAIAAWQEFTRQRTDPVV